jgi:hypothetical protein
MSMWILREDAHVDVNSPVGSTRRCGISRRADRGRRLIVDEPTGLAELDDCEREELHQELVASIAEADRGEVVDADVVLRELRASPPR